MDGALNHVAFPSQELVAVPIERAAGVRTGIDIGKDGIALTYQTHARSVGVQNDFLAGAVGEIVQAAQGLYGFGGVEVLLTHVVIG